MKATAAEVVEQQVAVDAARRKIDQVAAAAVSTRAEATAAVDAAVMGLNGFLANKESKASERATAVAALEAAALKLETSNRESAEAIAAAEEALRVAEAKLADMTTPPDVAAETVAVAQAQGTFDRASLALAELEARSGPTVPLGEVVFVSALPATVSTLDAEVPMARTSDPTGSTARSSMGSANPNRTRGTR